MNTFIIMAGRVSEVLSTQSPATVLLNTLLRYVPLVSVLFALGAFCISISSRKIAKRSLEISEKEAELRRPNLNVEISEFTFDFGSNGDRIFMIDAQLVNTSERSCSITSTELQLTYAHDGGEVILSIPAPQSPPAINLSSPNILQIPLQISANGAVRGQFQFRLPQAQYAGPVDKHTITFNDSRGLVIPQSLWHPKETHEKAHQSPN